MQIDANGDGAFDNTQTEVTVLNADGSAMETFTDLNGSGAVKEKVVTTTSASGLSKTTTWTGSNGSASLNQSATDVTVLNADGGAVNTVSAYDAGGVLKSKTVTATSADSLAQTIQLDVNADGATENVDATVVAADGSSTETLTQRNVNGTLKQVDVLTISANGQTQSLQRDSNGDGIYDHFETTALNADGGVTETVSDRKADGTLKQMIVTATSANGMSTTIQIDEDGNGSTDVTRTSETVLNADGSQTETISDFFGSGKLKDKLIITTSANGLTKTHQSDVNGDGVIDETAVGVTVLNTNGSTTETVTATRADGSLVARHTTTTSADNRTITTQTDSNGDGVVNQTQVVSIGLDGSRAVTTTNTSATGAQIERHIREISADGLTFTHTSYWDDNVHYYKDTTVNLPNANGSYVWSDMDYDNTVVSSGTHTVDANGVDTFTWNLAQRATNTSAWYYDSGTIRIDVATENKYLDIVKRLYDTVLDRDPLAWELQTSAYYFDGNTAYLTKCWAAYITPTGFDARLLAEDWSIPTSLLWLRGVHELDFVARFYQNAVGRAPQVSLTGGLNSELMSSLGQLNAGTMTVGDVVVAISESFPSVSWMGTCTPTSAARSRRTPFTTAETTDKTIAGDVVKTIYDVVYDRDPTATELSTGVNDLLAGNNGASDIAYNLVTSSAFTTRYGAMSDADFVSQMFVNTISRLPTAAEQQYWVSQLATGNFPREDLVNAFADSVEHLDLARVHAQQPYAGTHATGTAQLFAAGTGGTIAAGTATLTSNNAVTVTGTGGSVNVTGTQDSLTMSSGTVYLQAGTQLTLSGVSDTVKAAAGATLSLAAGAVVTMTGSSDTLNMAANSRATVTGTGDIVDVTGTGVTLTISNATIYVENGAAVTVTGTGDTIIVRGAASVTASGAAISVEFGATATLSGGNNTITQKSSSKLIMTGTGTGNKLIETGVNATAAINSAAITVNANSSVAISGASNTITGGVNDAILVQGASNKVSAGAEATSG